MMMPGSLFLEFLDIFYLIMVAFQDAINKDDAFMYHSLLSPYFNAGLLDPTKCVKAAEKLITNLMALFQ